MRPDIGLERRDIEVADHHAARAAVAPVLPPAGHLLKKLQLVGELVVDLRVRLVAAGRHVEIVDFDARHGGERVAPVRAPAPVARAALLDGQAGEDRNAVIGLDAVEHRMAVAERMEGLDREAVALDLDLLEAEHVGRALGRQALDAVDAQPDRVHVPACDPEPVSH